MLTWGRCKVCPFHFTTEKCVFVQRTYGCHACDEKDCWQASPKCPFFGRSRELHQDAAWGDSVPHMRETGLTCTADGLGIEGQQSVNWWKQYRNVCFHVNEVNHFEMGTASGDECNCLIDTIRQQLNLKCDIRAVRNYVQARHPSIAATDYLELQQHWKDIISGLAHVVGSNFVASSYQIICVDAMFIGNGDVEGNGARILYMARQNANHFVPLLKRSADAFVAPKKKRSYVQAMLDEIEEDVTEKERSCDHAMFGDMEEEVWLPVLNTGSSTALCTRWLKQVSPLLTKYDATLLHRYIPALSVQSLQKVCYASRSDYLNYLASCSGEQHDKAERISKMAMRRVLETTFARLATDDPAIDTVYAHWQATSDKPKRKSSASAKRHTAQWFRSRQHHPRKWYPSKGR